MLFYYYSPVVLIEERRVFNFCIFWDLDSTLFDQIPQVVKWTDIPQFASQNRMLWFAIDIFWKVNFFCKCVVKIVFKMQIYLVHQLLNCSCVYWKFRPIPSSKIRPINHKFNIIHILSYTEVAATRVSIFSIWSQSLVFMPNYTPKSK